ncbi:MAG: DUF5698 domain-containing protein [Bacilli bacterium]|nr:DUF5698 domain-containing protein [Bacilli bacterium]MDD4282318.1 DUF5698 domain-containing protein [Bacilli bacterium]MDD4718322.1 DUF5698 domain-containing protein [Bacilli bacterium]
MGGLVLKIFLIRILDVSMGTVRMILTVKGKKIIASIVGFIEISIWFAIVREALNTSTSNIWIIFAYAGGFAVGTLVGAMLSERFIKGSLNVQVITKRNKKIINTLRDYGYAVSVIDVQGKDDKQPKSMLILEVNKKDFNHLQDLIRKLDNKAFIVVNETKYVQNGYFRQNAK